MSENQFCGIYPKNLKSKLYKTIDLKEKGLL